jgi:hypothetical protein
MASDNADSKPRECPEKGRDHDQEPKRPRDRPEQEVNIDAFCVLEHKRQEQSTSGQRQDRSEAKLALARLRFLTRSDLALFHICHNKTLLSFQY